MKDAKTYATYLAIAVSIAVIVALVGYWYSPTMRAWLTKDRSTPVSA